IEVDPKSGGWIGGPERLTTGIGPDTDIAISQDGRKLAFTARTERTRLWSLPFDAGSGRIKGDGRPITSAGVNALFPDLSPDGQKWVFFTYRAGKTDLVENSLKDGRKTAWEADDLVRHLPHWSRDGSRLSYHGSRGADTERPNPERTIVLLPAGGGEEQIL